MVTLTFPSLHTLYKTQMGVFLVSGQSLIKENCNNSRTRNNTDMELGSVTKLNKRNAADVISANCDVVVIFSI